MMASFPCQAFPVQINLSTARAILLRGEDSAGSRRWTSHEITFAFLFEAILKLGANWSARSGAPLTTSPAVLHAEENWISCLGVRLGDDEIAPRLMSRAIGSCEEIFSNRISREPPRPTFLCPPSSERVSLSLSARRFLSFLHSQIRFQHFEDEFISLFLLYIYIEYRDVFLVEKNKILTLSYTLVNVKILVPC